MSKLTIFFSGDYAPYRDYEKLVLDKGREVFGDLQEDIAVAALSFLNLETPLCLSGKPIKKDGPNICSHPDCIKAVVDAGFDVAGLANNHIMDFDKDGLTGTLDVCQQMDLTICGAGMTIEEAQQPLLIQRKGLKIALIALAEHEFSIAGPDKPGAAPLDPIGNTLQIVQTLKQADLVFVTIHGGNEYFPFPRPGLRKLCRYYIDLGVDAVICHHAHVPGAYEIYNSKPIVYSLGNLIFDHNNPPEGWNEGYAVRLDYDEITKSFMSINIISYTQSVIQGGIRKMQLNEKNYF